MRRGFYKTVHAVLPEAIRRPIRRVVRGDAAKTREKRERMLEARRRAKDEATRAKLKAKEAKEARRAAKAESERTRNAQ